MKGMGCRWRHHHFTKQELGCHHQPLVPQSSVLTHWDEGDYEAGNATGQVCDGHDGASAESVDQQVEDEAGGKLHHSREEEVQVEVIACDPQPQDQALKHDSTCKPG